MFEALILIILLGLVIRSLFQQTRAVISPRPFAVSTTPGQPRYESPEDRAEI